MSEITPEVFFFFIHPFLSWASLVSSEQKNLRQAWLSLISAYMYSKYKGKSSRG